jgi:hypothetical protein
VGFWGISDRFDFVSFDTYCQRSLDCLYGNNQRAVSIARDQYALHAIEGPALDAHALANLKVGMGRPGQFSFHQTPNRFDLRVWNGRALAPGTNQSEYSVDPKDA